MPARKNDLDIFVEFLLGEGDFDSVSEAANECKFDARTLNRASARKIRSIPAMIRWVDIFGIPRERFGRWIAANIDALAADTELIDIAV